MLEAWGTHLHPLGAGPLPPGLVGDLVSLLVHRRAISSHLFSHYLHLPCPKEVFFADGEIEALKTRNLTCLHSC